VPTQIGSCRLVRRHRVGIKVDLAVVHSEKPLAVFHAARVDHEPGARLLAERVTAEGCERAALSVVAEGC
jgi:hypothetical protein